MTDPIDPDHHASRPPPFPRWVVWLGIGVLVAVLLVLGLHLLTGGGTMNHGGTHAGTIRWTLGPAERIVGNPT